MTKDHYSEMGKIKEVDKVNKQMKDKERLIRWCRDEIQGDRQNEKNKRMLADIVLYLKNECK